MSQSSKILGRGRVRPKRVDPPAHPTTGHEAIPGPSGRPGGESREPSGRPGTRSHIESRIVSRPSPDFIKEGREGPLFEMIQSNYLRVLSRPNWPLLQYRVDFTPEQEDTRLKKALFRPHSNNIGKNIFNGTDLFTAAKLLQPYQLTSAHPSDGSLIRLNLRFVKEVLPDDEVYVNIMNIIFRRCLAMLNLVEIRRDFYDPEAAQDIPNHDIRLFPGYLTSIRYHEEALLLSIDVITKAMRMSNVLHLLKQCMEDALGERDRFEHLAKEKLIGRIVMVQYGKRITYRIDDIALDKNPRSTFTSQKDDEISFLNYYKSRWNITIRDERQPLLVCRPTRRDLNRGDDQLIFLIPELCNLTGLPESLRGNTRDARTIQSVARRDPGERVASLLRFRHRIFKNEMVKNELDNWGLSFSEDLVTCRARKLTAETIVQGNKKYLMNDKGDWSRNVTSSQMATSAVLTNWLVITPRRLDAEVQSFLSELKSAGSAIDFRLTEPLIVKLDNDNKSDYVRSLSDQCRARNFNIVLVILSSKIRDKYNAIKVESCVNIGIPTQVIARPTITQGGAVTKSCARKVVIQMASKVGAEPWRLNLPSQDWMVCGFDAFHDKNQSKAVGAFVASTNTTFTRYVSMVEIHPSNEDISPYFAKFMLKSLKAYKDANKKLPSRIFVYRDGVGSGDLERVKDIEIGQIKKAFSDVSRLTNQHYEPGLAYIVVSKRISTRFFHKKPGPSQEGYVNPPSGVVVDNTVTLPERFDFFIVSQSATQGTVSPTSYHVLEDSSKTSPDIHQRLAYALTHLYFNWPGPLRVPAPCQYAHKLAYLVGETGMGQPKEQLSNLPYYL